MDLKRAADKSPGPIRAPLLKWRWYYFYFVLAAVDVIVILAGVFVHHSTLTSFDAALVDVAEAHQRQRWLSDLQSALIELNAPGNDVFETGNLEEAEKAFGAALAAWHELVEQRPTEAAALAEAFAHVERMIAAEQRIFARLHESAMESPESAASRDALDEATASMAMMDRAQASAFALLEDVSAELRARQRARLDHHRLSLRRRTRVEIIFVLVVLLILIGVFWYGRKLHETHERLLAGSRKVEEERSRRLASVGAVCFQCAHGIRNPLASIASSAQLLLEYGNLEEASSRRVRDIVSTCGVLSERIGRLMGHARVKSLQFETVRAPDILDQAVAEVQDGVRDRGITIRRAYECGDVSFQTDRSLLVQAVIELIGNAMVHAGEGCTVILRSRRPSAESIELGVADDGPGIPNEVKGRVCDLFFTTRPEGHGIGLASVQRSADRLGGRLMIEDVEPHGAYLALVLPLQGSVSAPR